MPATVLIKRLTGAGPTETDITAGSTRLKQADNGTADTSNPVPATGTIDSNAAVSCWCVTQLNCTVTPANTINNLKWYSNNPTLQTGLRLRGESATSYVQAVTTGLTFGGAGQLNTTTYSTLSAGSGANGAVICNTAGSGTYTSGTPKSVTGSITNPSTGLFGDRMVFQLQVEATASPGTISPTMTMTWQYDET